METQDLSIFLTVAESGGFSPAAQRLGLTPSAVSKAVARLECDLGVRLLARSTRRVALTEEGRQFRERCQPILADLMEAREALAAAGAAPAGRLRLSLPTALGHLKIVPALPGFLARYPDITLDVRLSDSPADLIEGGIDVAVRVGEMADSRLIVRRLWRPPYATCAAPAYLARAGKPQQLEDLDAHECLGRFVDHLGRVRPWRFRVAGQPVEVMPRGRLTLDRAESLCAAARAGAGIIQVNRYIVEDDLTAGRLVPLLETFAPPGPPLQAVTLAGRQSVPRICAMVNFLAGLFHNCPDAE